MPVTPEIHIRPVIDSDAKSFAEVFNYFILHSFAAYPETPVDESVMERMVRMAAGLPVVTIETIDGENLGFAALRPIHMADTLRRTAEVSMFIRSDATGKGIGTKVLAWLEEEARKLDIVSLIGGASSLNEQSLSFQRKSGFVECGRFRRAGVKFGKEYDVVWMQKFL
jgi:phosphinothricin acetyltransferase